MPATLSGDEAAKLIMVEPRQVRKLAQLGYIKRVSTGHYDAISVAQGYIRWLKEERKSDARIAAENRVRDARARDFEVRTDRMCQELAEVDELEEILDEIIGELRNEMVGFSAKVTRDPRIRRQIDEAVEGVFARAVEKKQMAIALLRGGGSISDLDGEAEA